MSDVDPLDESGAHTNAERMDAATTPQGRGLVLRGLIERESYWRERLGDEVYDQAVAHWRRLAVQGPAG